MRITLVDAILVVSVSHIQYPLQWVGSMQRIKSINLRTNSQIERHLVFKVVVYWGSLVGFECTAQASTDDIRIEHFQCRPVLRLW
jgi:hypothetical protein